jgi:hypothetical protein
MREARGRCPWPLSQEFQQRGALVSFSSPKLINETDTIEQLEQKPGKHL